MEEKGSGNFVFGWKLGKGQAGAIESDPPGFGPSPFSPPSTRQPNRTPFNLHLWWRVKQFRKKNQLKKKLKLN